MPTRLGLRAPAREEATASGVARPRAQAAAPGQRAETGGERAEAGVEGRTEVGGASRLEGGAWESSMGGASRIRRTHAGAIEHRRANGFTQGQNTCI